MSASPISITGPVGQLEGVLEIPKAPGPHPVVVACHPHPLHGGNMNNNVVMAAVNGLLNEHIATLRFNFRGVGASEGTHNGTGEEQHDALAAIESLKATSLINPDRIGICGYSFGAGVAVLAAAMDPATKAVAAIAPPVEALSDPKSTSHNAPKLVIAGGLDTFIPIEAIQSAMDNMTGSAELINLVGADHFFSGSDSQIARAVGRFFATELA